MTGGGGGEGKTGSSLGGTPASTAMGGVVGGGRGRYVPARGRAKDGELAADGASKSADGDVDGSSGGEGESMNSAAVDEMELGMLKQEGDSVGLSSVSLRTPRSYRGGAADKEFNPLDGSTSMTSITGPSGGGSAIQPRSARVGASDGVVGSSALQVYLPQLCSVCGCRPDAVAASSTAIAVPIPATGRSTPDIGERRLAQQQQISESAVGGGAATFAAAGAGQKGTGAIDEKVENAGSSTLSAGANEKGNEGGSSEGAKRGEEDPTEAGARVAIIGAGEWHRWTPSTHIPLDAATVVALVAALPLQYSSRGAGESSPQSGELPPASHTAYPSVPRVAQSTLPPALPLEENTSISRANSAIHSAFNRVTSQSAIAVVADEGTVITNKEKNSIGCAKNRAADVFDPVSAIETFTAHHGASAAVALLPDVPHRALVLAITAAVRPLEPSPSEGANSRNLAPKAAVAVADGNISVDKAKGRGSGRGVTGRPRSAESTGKDAADDGVGGDVNAKEKAVNGDVRGSAESNELRHPSYGGPSRPQQPQYSAGEVYDAVAAATAAAATHAAVPAGAFAVAADLDMDDGWNENVGSKKGAYSSGGSGDDGGGQNVSADVGPIFNAPPLPVAPIVAVSSPSTVLPLRRRPTTSTPGVSRSALSGRLANDVESSGRGEGSLNGESGGGGKTALKAGAVGKSGGGVGVTAVPAIALHNWSSADAAGDNNGDKPTTSVGAMEVDPDGTWEAESRHTLAVRDGFCHRWIDRSWWACATCLRTN